MLKQEIFTVDKNIQIAKDVFLLRMFGKTDAITAPGQFVNIALPGFYLRRPISVADTEDGVLTLIYKVVGRGTESMKGLQRGSELDILTGLGNGFDTSKSGNTPLLVGGGVGVPPLYYLAKQLIAQGKNPRAVFGFASSQDIFFVNEFEALDCPVSVTTVDGTAGTRGIVTDVLPSDYSFFYACGPLPMLKALKNATKTSGELSLEERMGCGFGACMGCSIETAKGPKRVCKDGPVFEKEDLLW
ncbi:MAG: dihydroorotate dehydrogenase electron transfer subunit [Synergistaceae bacterium]|nr:dihydroorotate dehydrogenase electron transfer subunit [Synergistaceae bacterium]